MVEEEWKCFQEIFSIKLVLDFLYFSCYYQEPNEITKPSINSSISSYHKNGHLAVTNLFICDDGTMILASSVCDRLADCFGEEDEQYCLKFTHLEVHSELCNMITKEGLIGFEWNCPLLNNISTSQKLCVNTSIDLPSTLTFDFTNKPGNNSFIRSEIESEKYCIFQPNDCGVLRGHAYGSHLISCENYTCPDRYFKCPGFYCISWRYVCNSKADCPGGTDETGCPRATCPGMFRCKHSGICLSLLNVCDGSSDCIMNDDEQLCLVKLSCPQHCSCLLFSLSCISQKLEINTVCP